MVYHVSYDNLKFMCIRDGFDIDSLKNEARTRWDELLGNKNFHFYENKEGGRLLLTDADLQGICSNNVVDVKVIEDVVKEPPKEPHEEPRKGPALLNRGRGRGRGRGLGRGRGSADPRLRAPSPPKGTPSSVHTLFAQVQTPEKKDNS